MSGDRRRSRLRHASFVGKPIREVREGASGSRALNRGGPFLSIEGARVNQRLNTIGNSATPQRTRASHPTEDIQQRGNQLIEREEHDEAGDGNETGANSFDADVVPESAGGGDGDPAPEENSSEISASAICDWRVIWSIIVVTGSKHMTRMQF